MSKNRYDNWSEDYNAGESSTAPFGADFLLYLEIGNLHTAIEERKEAGAVVTAEKINKALDALLKGDDYGKYSSLTSATIMSYGGIGHNHILGECPSLTDPLKKYICKVIGEEIGTSDNVPGLDQ